MFAVCVVVTALLAAGALASAALKLQKKEEIVVSIRDHLGMSLTVLPKLAALEIAGAIGSLVVQPHRGAVFGTGDHRQ